MNLPKYLHAATPELGAGLIINTENLYLGHIILYKDYLSMSLALNRKTSELYRAVNGYNIAVHYAGILGKGNRIIGGADVLQKIQEELVEMVKWYETEKINKHLSRYKRYLT